MSDKLDIRQKNKELFEQLSKETDPVLCNQIKNQIFDLNVALAIRQASKVEKGRFSYTCADIDDAFQAAYLSLWNAIEHFDSSLGAEFSTYATTAIKNGIIREFQNSQNSFQTQYVQALKKLESQNIEATSENIQKMMNVDDATFAFGFRLNNQTFMDEKRYESDDATFGELVVDPNVDVVGTGIKNVETQEIFDAMKELPERDQKIVWLRVVKEVSFAQIAQQLNISRRYVELLFEKSIRKIRASIQERYLASDTQQLSECMQIAIGMLPEKTAHQIHRRYGSMSMKKVVEIFEHGTFDFSKRGFLAERKLFELYKIVCNAQVMPEDFVKAILLNQQVWPNWLSVAVARLPQENQEIIRFVYVEHLSFDQVGEIIGHNREKVVRTVKKTIELLAQIAQPMIDKIYFDSSCIKQK